MEQPTQAVMEEIAERFAEHAPAKQIPFLLGMENQRHIWRDWRANVRSSNRIMNKVSGLSDDEIGDSQVDDMGDISVSGDSSSTTTNHYHGASGDPSASRLLTKSIPFVVSAAALAAAAWSISTRPDAAPGPVDAEYEVLFYDANGNLIDMPRR